MRDTRIDFLRFIGLTLIIMAHVNPPGWLFQLRNFDVPLMVLLSGLSFSYAKGEVKLIPYTIKRFKRLVLPVWIFLSGYFIVSGVIAGFHDWKTIVESYFFLSGIGYVWIIRVFLIVALIAPFIKRISDKVESNWTFLLLLFAVIISYEIFVTVALDKILTIRGGNLFNMVFLYGLIYATIFGLGLRFRSLSMAALALVLAFFFISFCIAGYFLYIENGHFVHTQQFKYPPQLYYLGYAITVSSILWFICVKFEYLLEKDNTIQRTWKFISQNTIWIYLWHIPFAETITTENVPGFVLRYVLVYAGAASIAFVQIYVVKGYLFNGTSQASKKKAALNLFTG